MRDVAELACKEASLLSAFALTNTLGTDRVKGPHAELLCLLELAPEDRPDGARSDVPHRSPHNTFKRDPGQKPS